MRTKLKLFLPSLALALALAAPANAATQLGDLTTVNNVSCDQTSLVWITSAPYVVTAPGVVTELRGAAGTAPARFSVKMIRPSTKTVLGTTPEQLLAAPGGVTVPVRISVVAGDVVGLRTATPAYSCGRPTTASDTSQQVVSMPMDPGPGPFAGMVIDTSGFRLAIGAKVEPDVNNDGFGDETQQCRVPSLKKLTKTKAKAALTKAGCVLGTTKKKKIRKFTKKNRRNRVRSQSLKAGTVKPIGTLVNITINTKKPKKK